jgi:hypothetical protein
MTAIDVASAQGSPKMAKTFSQRLGELADSVLEPVWTRVMKMAWPVRAGLLLSLLLGVIAWQFPGIVKPVVGWVQGPTAQPGNAGLVEPPPTGPAPMALAQLPAPRPVAEIRAELAPILGAELHTADLAQQTAWSLAQTMVALSDSREIQLERDQLAEQILASRHGEKFCWSELLNEDEQPCTFFVTGWVLSAFARFDRGVQPADIDYALAQQFPNGAWPMFEGGTEAYSSTYTTCWMIYGLHEQLQKGLLPEPQAAQARRAIGRAAVWLRQNKEEGKARWRPFPGLRGSKESLSISGLAVHALGIASDGSLASLHRDWIESLPEDALAMPAEHSTYQEVMTMRGTRIDHFVQFNIPWSIVATTDAMAVEDPALREKGRQFLRGALANAHVGTADSDPRAWWRAELLIGLAYLERSRLSL